jgi:hypothetical protein
LEQLKSKLLVMGALVESAVCRSITSVVQRDRKMAEAELAARSALRLAPLDEDAHYLLGMALLRQDHVNEETAGHLAAAAHKNALAKAAYEQARQILATKRQSP